jgi:SAM-dependent methyltransferase
MKFSSTPPMLLYRRLARSIYLHGLRGAVARSWYRLVRSLRSHGIWGTWERAFVKPPQPAVVQDTAPPHPFDLRHGTDTGGYVLSTSLDSASLATAYSNVYFAISPSSLAQAISALPGPLDKFTFLDLGCGKGRALMVAAEFPLHRILGVEISSELCAIAQANVDRNPDWAARISILNQDAATVTYPDTPLVIFLYHPFFAPILRRVLANLERELRRAPRETWLLYADNPRFTEVLDRFPFLREISETAYPLTPEDTAAHRFHLTHESITLYRANLDA